MKFIPWLLALSVLIILTIEAVALHKATVCRQKAWLKTTELMTRLLLSNPPENDRTVDLNCRIMASRHQKTITWQRLPNLKKHPFSVDLKGRL
jgi:hypothetical protein